MALLHLISDSTLSDRAMKALQQRVKELEKVQEESHSQHRRASMDATRRPSLVSETNLTAASLVCTCLERRLCHGGMRGGVVST